MITVKGLRKAFNGRQILGDVSLEVEAGEILGLVGPSGAGKSTTLNIVAGLLEPDSGMVVVDGVMMTKMNGNPAISSQATAPRYSSALRKGRGCSCGCA